MLLNAVNARADDDVDDVDDQKDSAKKQTNKYIQNYFDAELIESLKNKKEEESVRVDKLIDYLQVKLGIKFPDPDLRKRLASLVNLYNGATIGPTRLKETYDLITKTNVRKREPRKHVHTTMKHFPKDPAEFDALHPGRITTPTSKCEFSQNQIDDVVALTPCRKNNALIKSKATEFEESSRFSTFPGSSSGNQINDPLGAMVKQMMMQQIASMMGMSGMSRNRSPSPRPKRRGPLAIELGDDEEEQGHEKRNRTTNEEDQGREKRSRTTNNFEDRDGDDDDGDLSGETEPHSLPLGDGKEVDGDAADDIDKEIAEAMRSKKLKEDKEKQKRKDAASKKKTENETKGSGPKKQKTLDAKPKADADKQTLGKTPKSTSKVNMEIVEYARAKPPAFDSDFPLLYNGCKVLACKDRYRVWPKPGKSLYDKAFVWTKSSKREVWSKVIEYCKKPSIPTTSKNYVK